MSTDPEQQAHDQTASVEAFRLGVGLTGSDSTRIWCHPRSGERWQLEICDRNGNRARPPIEISARDDGRPQTVVVDGLAPATAYQVRADIEGVTGRPTACFKTAPRPGSTDRPVRFAFTSCHQPFDGDGTPRDDAVAMLARCREWLDQREVDFMVHLGDQMYVDEPDGWSLDTDDGDHLTRSESELVAHLRQRYRRFFGLPDFAGLLRDRPNTMIPDDHEFADNFGTDPVHASAKWAGYRNAALMCCHEYQGLRAVGDSDRRPDAFDHEITWGPVSLFIADLRSERVSDEDQVTPMSDAQFERLESFLERTRDQSLTVLGLSVPLAHVPEWMAKVGTQVGGLGGNAADRWAHPRQERARVRLLELIRQEAALRWPERHLLLLGGDVHVGAISVLRWESDDEDDAPRVVQATSSAFTNAEHPAMQLLAALAPGAVGSVHGADGSKAGVDLLDLGGENPTGRLNLGLVEWLPGSPPKIRVSLAAWNDQDLEEACTHEL